MPPRVPTGLAQAAAGALGGVLAVAWQVLGRAWWDHEPPAVMLLLGAAMAAFGLAHWQARHTLRRLVPQPSRPVAAGEAVIMAGCAIGALACLAGTAAAWVGAIEPDDADLAALPWWFLGLGVVTLGQLVLAAGLLRRPLLRPFALGAAAFVVGVLVFLNGLEYEWEGAGAPPLRIKPIAWALLWGASHVLAGLAATRLAERRPAQ